MTRSGKAILGMTMGVLAVRAVAQTAQGSDYTSPQWSPHAIALALLLAVGLCDAPWKRQAVLSAGMLLLLGIFDAVTLGMTLRSPQEPAWLILMGVYPALAALILATGILVSSVHTPTWARRPAWALFTSAFIGSVLTKYISSDTGIIWDWAGGRIVPIALFLGVYFFRRNTLRAGVAGAANLPGQTTYVTRILYIGVVAVAAVVAEAGLGFIILALTQMPVRSLLSFADIEVRAGRSEIGVAILVAAFGGFFYFKRWRDGQIGMARAVYDQSLAALAAAPGDAGRRADALAAGRAYFATTRGIPGSTRHVVSVYDETAINNDIGARTGAVGPGTAAPQDQKACPLCGEAILSVAIRCKHCHADLGAM